MALEASGVDGEERQTALGQQGASTRRVPSAMNGRVGVDHDKMRDDGLCLVEVESKLAQGRQVARQNRKTRNERNGKGCEVLWGHEHRCTQ